MAHRREKVEAVIVFLFLGSKITKDSDWSHEIKRDLQSSHVQMWELDCRESWAPKNGSFQTVVMEKTLKSPLNSKSIKPVSLKGNQPWIFIGKTDGKAEAPILWPSDVRSWLIGKDSDAGKDWGQEEKGLTEDELFGWYHQLDGHEFEQTPRDSEGQESLTCFCEWGHRVRHDLATKQQLYSHLVAPSCLKVKMKVNQLCPTIFDPMDYTVHGIFQARILEWVAFPFSRWSSQPRDGTQVSHIAGGFFTSWATREAQEYWIG